MKKIVQVVKSKKYYIISFILPILIFLFISILTGTYPFGDVLLNKYDSIYFYTAIIEESIQKIRSGSSIFYTLHAGLGSNFFNIMTCYANSPLNLLFLFFNSSQIYNFYTILIYMKIGLCGLSLFIYFNHLNKSRAKANLNFSLLYALSSYCLFLNYHVMWFDGIILAPLVIYGIDKLIDNKKSIYYIIFLTLAIYTNFYTGYMICIFSCLYFIYKIVNVKENKKNTIISFFKSSLVCGILNSFIIIPSAIALLSGRGFLETNYFKFNINNLINLFYNFTPGSLVETDNYMNGNPTIVLNLFALVLTIMYFFNDKFNKKQKIATGFVILFFFISFSYNFFDYAWNMFTAPVWWNSRYSFLFILLITIIAYNSFIHIDKLKMNYISRMLFTLLLFVLIMLGLHNKLLGDFQYYIQGRNLKLEDYKLLYLYNCIDKKNIIILTLEAIFIEIYFLTADKKNKLIKYMLSIMVFFEIIFNGYTILNTNYCSITEVQDNYSENHYNINEIKNKDNSWYRIYDYKDLACDEGMFFGYNSTQLFCSVYNGRINSFYSKFANVNGYSNVKNYIKIDIPYIELLSLLNVKYIINNDIEINPYVLPLGFLIKDNETPTLEENSNVNLEKIYSYLANTEESIYDVPDMHKTIENLTFNDEGYIKTLGNVGKINCEFISEVNGFINVGRNRFMADIYVNDEYQENKVVEVKKNDKVKIEYYFYKYELEEVNIKESDIDCRILNGEKFKEIVNELSEKSLNIDTEDTLYIISGNIEVKQDNQKLFLSIPYDKGLIIKVNGKKVKFNEEFGTFISVNLDKGQHSITIDYIPKGFLIGMGISVSMLMLLLFQKLVITNNNKKITNNLSKYRKK